MMQVKIWVGKLNSLCWPRRKPLTKCFSGDGVTESIDPAEDTGPPALDAFDGDTSKSIDAFCSAAHGPEAFARPSAEVAALARLAAKVGLQGTVAGPLAKGSLSSVG